VTVARPGGARRRERSRRPRRPAGGRRRCADRGGGAVVGSWSGGVGPSMTWFGTPAEVSRERRTSAWVWWRSPAARRRRSGWDPAGGLGERGRPADEVDQHGLVRDRFSLEQGKCGSVVLQPDVARREERRDHGGQCGGPQQLAARGQGAAPRPLRGHGPIMTRSPGWGGPRRAVLASMTNESRTGEVERGRGHRCRARCAADRALRCPRSRRPSRLPVLDGCCACSWTATSADWTPRTPSSPVDPLTLDEVADATRVVGDRLDQARPHGRASLHAGGQLTGRRTPLTGYAALRRNVGRSSR
jgi:hypothetical protein